MLDLVLKILALASFVASLMVLVIYVPDIDLTIVLLIVIAMAVYDFLVRPILRRRNNHR